MPAQTHRYEDLKAELLQDSETRAAYEALEPAYQVTCLRIERGLTQEELARKAHMRQPHIARLESGRTTPSLATLRRVAEALDARLVVRLEPKEWESPAT